MVRRVHRAIRNNMGVPRKNSSDTIFHQNYAIGGHHTNFVLLSLLSMILIKSYFVRALLKYLPFLKFPSLYVCYLMLILVNIVGGF
jgi:hypothetical protein